MTRTIVLANGGNPWKHTTPIDGEPVLERVVRLFRRGGEVIVSGPYEIPGAARFQPVPDPTDDGNLGTRPLWDAAGRTLIVYGDVWYSEAAARVMLEDADPGWHLFARFGPSALTGKPYAEPWGHAFLPQDHAWAEAAFRFTVQLWQAGTIPRSGAWEVYRHRHGRLLPFTYEQANLGGATEINDWTEDFDKLEDLTTWLRRRAEAGAGATGWQAIPGWFGFAAAYDRLVAAAPAARPAMIIEIGAWKGRSTAYLAEAILGSGKPLTLCVVDHWQAPDVEGAGLPPASEADKALGTLRAVFDRNLAPYAAELGSRFQVRQGDSAAAAAAFAPGSLYGVWVDGDHSEAGVARDIEAWWPLLEPGGYMGGDDWNWPTVRAAVEAAFGPERVEVHDGRWWWCQKARQSPVASANGENSDDPPSAPRG